MYLDELLQIMAGAFKVGGIGKHCPCSLAALLLILTCARRPVTTSYACPLVTGGRRCHVSLGAARTQPAMPRHLLAFWQEHQARLAACTLCLHLMHNSSALLVLCEVSAVMVNIANIFPCS